jgi:hypothetical protein
MRPHCSLLFNRQGLTILSEDAQIAVFAGMEGADLGEISASGDVEKINDKQTWQDSSFDGERLPCDVPFLLVFRSLFSSH